MERQRMSRKDKRTFNEENGNERDGEYIKLKEEKGWKELFLCKKEG